MRTMREQLVGVKVLPVTGRVKWFDEHRGYGFITTDDTDVMIHMKVLRESGFAAPKPGDYIEIETERQNLGRRATKVLVLRKDLPIEERMKLQNAEFVACRELSDAILDHDRIPVVDDAYPEHRHRYEDALSTFLAACKANGRVL